MSASSVDAAEAESILQSQHLDSYLRAFTTEVCIVRVRYALEQIFEHEDQFLEALRGLRNEGRVHEPESIARWRLRL
jgi:hypothetical protein